MGRKGKIALMGSGELTSSMVEVHKGLLAGHPGGEALFLDTPAGFQPNATDISEKAMEYFRKNIQSPLSIASYRSADSLSSFELQALQKRIAEAHYMLIGPGSPTYMLDQLGGSPLIAAMEKIVLGGGCLAIASAAALTAGLHTLPVYEIYKVGKPLHWCDGLNILGSFGLDMVVIPHWNNAEGGNHDTRFCYMGEDRFNGLRDLLSDEILYLGIDEHTALIIDLEEQKVEVRGLGTITLLQGERSQTMSSGESFPIDILHGELVGDDGKQPENLSSPEIGSEGEMEDSFWAQVHEFEERCKEGLKSGNFASSASSILDLDSFMNSGLGKAESEENRAQAREIYREMIVLLGVECQRVQQRAQQIFEPLVERIVSQRSSYKEEKRWEEADKLRDILELSHIRLKDKQDSTVFFIDEGGDI